MDNHPSGADLARACIGIINAASALIVNVDFLANASSPEQREVVEDARRSIARIVKLAREVSTAVDGTEIEPTRPDAGED